MPSLRQTVTTDYETLSIVTVRHPLDSYLSLISQGWLHFSPQTIDEYSRRYLQFLEEYSHCEVFKYEDLVESSASIMRRICQQFSLPYSNGFEQVLGAFNLSGDSGRSSTRIGIRERRAIPQNVISEIEQAKQFEKLCCSLDYQLLI